MIKINLVNAYRAQLALTGGDGGVAASTEESQAQAKGLLNLVIIALAPIGLFAYQSVTIPEKEALVAARQQSLTELQAFNSKAEKAVGEIKKFKEDEILIQKRISYLEQLNKNKMREVKALDLIQQKIPQKVWLNTLKVDRGVIQIDGTSMSDFEISQFSSDLSKSIYFSNVELLGANEIDFRGTKVRKFELRCSMENP